MIPFNDLRPALHEIRFDINAAIKRVMDRGVFLNGPEVEAFEQEWAEYCGARYCVACASGTDALMLGAKIFRAENLAIAANGCSFTRTGLQRGGANVECFDVDGRGHCDSWHVVATLLYGRQWIPYRFDDCHVLFDACQAHGWKPPAKAIVAWSGYPTKNLGGFGDCGWLTVSEDREFRAARIIAAEWHSRMSELNAAVLRTKLPHLDRWNREREQLAEVYWEEMPKTAEFVTRPYELTNHHIFAILTDCRDELEKHLLANEIQVKCHYREPLAPLPGATRWCSRVLSLPMYPGLKPEQVRTMCDTIRMFLG